MFGIWCRVSGGVTGCREAWLKSNDHDRAGAKPKRVEFAERAEAEAEAKALNERMNGLYRTIDFRYSVEEIMD